MNTNELRHYYELEAGETEWKRQLAQTAFEGFPEFIAQSGRELAARYSDHAGTFGDIIERVGYTDRRILRRANPITLHANAKDIFTATLIAHQFGEFGYDSVTTYVRREDAGSQENREHTWNEFAASLKEEFRPPTTHYRLWASDFNFLESNYAWIGDEAPERSIKRFLDLRRAILPVILHATDTQSTLIEAINNPQLNPEIPQYAHAQQQA